MPRLVWFITGCSKGLGETLAYAALARGDRVIATARAPVSRLAKLEQAGACIFELDVTHDRPAINAVVEKACAVYGRIDVMVPNAVESRITYLEDLTPQAWAEAMAINLFGVVNVVTAVLPHFRHQRNGTVAFMSSIFGYTAFAGSGMYGVAKHAVEGFAKTLAAETADLNIRTVSFGMGFIRTDLCAQMSIKPPSFEEYGPGFAAAGEAFASVPGNEPGDPAKFADRIIDIVKVEGAAAGRSSTPFVPLGSDAYQTIRKRAEQTIQICDQWEEMSKGTDYPEPKKGLFAMVDHY